MAVLLQRRQREWDQEAVRQQNPRLRRNRMRRRKAQQGSRIEPLLENNHSGTNDPSGKTAAGPVQSYCASLLHTIVCEALDLPYEQFCALEPLLQPREDVESREPMGFSQLVAPANKGSERGYSSSTKQLTMSSTPVESSSSCRVVPVVEYTDPAPFVELLPTGTDEREAMLYALLLRLASGLHTSEPPGSHAEGASNAQQAQSGAAQRVRSAPRVESVDGYDARARQILVDAAARLGVP
eukprot:6183739-Pleurochrysis_carterae.AAC.3